jgi:HSP20 family molecular chaperone IbpA
MTFYFTPSRRMPGMHMANMRQAMERMMEESFAEPRENERELLLAVDVQASDEGCVINALVPGLAADDLEIEIINNTVTCAASSSRSAKRTANTCQRAARRRLQPGDHPAHRRGCRQDSG